MALFKMIKEVTVVMEDHVVPAAVVHHAASTVEILEVAVDPEGRGLKTVKAKEGRQAAARRVVNSSKEASVPATARGARLGHVLPVAA